MKNLFPLSCARKFGSPIINLRLVALSSLLAAFVGFAPLLLSHAQKPKKGQVNVYGVSTQSSSNGTVVSIAADGSLNGAQTWQDSEGYHVVLPSGVKADSLKSDRGVKIRHLGQSVEILLQTKPGANVTFQRLDNRLNLAIDGKLGTRTNGSAANTEEDSGDSSSSAQSERKKSENDIASTSQPTSQNIDQIPNNSAAVNLQNSNSRNQLNPNKIVPQQDGTTPSQTASRITLQPEDDGLLASVFSGTGMLVVIAFGLVALLLLRKLRSRRAPVAHEEMPVNNIAERSQGPEQSAGSVQSLKTGEPQQSLVQFGTPGARLPVATPASLYGAYRIDQEVGKLVLGQPHRMDVLSSRATDDRRAIETSLIKIINSAADDNERRRACEALEEYGLVARQCAALLLAPDAFDRTTAARTLGEIKSPSALPFLLEALYDPESIVRNQAVVSIGELKIPSAIGALLDISRKHPDISGTLLSRSLSACSLEGLDFFDTDMSQSSYVGLDGGENRIHEFDHLEPASSVQDLPESPATSTEEEELTQALSKLESASAEERSEAVKSLAEVQVQRSVAALASVARDDPEPSVRAQAISSLASINHESVFPAVLIGMADESREVRASAARSLSRLSFDRADAYVRVIETSDEQTLRDVASASIKAGIVSQGIDRLASSDHRQAYEAYSIVSLLAKARMTAPVLEAISSHASLDVRLAAVRLLATIDHPEVLEQLRGLAVSDGLAEQVRTALLEAMYKLDKAKTEHQEDPTSPDVETDSSHAGDGVELTSNVEPEFVSEIETHVDEL